ncbi:unnamed protein product, partial [Closterium sp. NIES-53]
MRNRRRVNTVSGSLAGTDADIENNSDGIGGESERSFKRTSAAVSWRVRMAPGQQASAEGMAVEGAEDEGEADLGAATSVEVAGVVDTAATTRATDAVTADSTASATIQLVKNEMVAGIRVKGEPDEVLGCPTYMQAKFTRYLFSSSEATAKAPLDEVVMDVVGPLKLGAAGAEYFLTIVDIYTRMTWVYVLSKKSDVAET